MGIRLLSVALMFATTSANALDATQLMPELTWEKRVLLTFAPDESHAVFRRQVALLDAVEAGLPERDMTVIQVFADGRVAIDGDLHLASASSFYQRFSVATDVFRVILVGKDGTVKLDRVSAVSGGDLFALIDAMPMRRLEMLQN